MLFALSAGAAKQVVYTNCPGLLCLFPFLSGLRRRPPGPVFRPGDRPFSPFRRPVFPPIFPGFAILVILLTKRSIIGFSEDFKKQSFLVHLSLIFLFLHEKALPHLHPLFKFPFLHRSLMSWRAAVVVAVLLFSPLLFPFFKSKRKTKKSKEKQSKEKQKAEQKEDNVLVLFLLPFHLFFIPFPLSPFSFPFFFPSFSIRHVCTHVSPLLMCV